MNSCLIFLNYLSECQTLIRSIMFLKMFVNVCLPSLAAKLSPSSTVGARSDDWSDLLHGLRQTLPPLLSLVAVEVAVVATVVGRLEAELMSAEVVAAEAVVAVAVVVDEGGALVGEAVAAVVEGGVGVPAQAVALVPGEEVPVGLVPGLLVLLVVVLLEAVKLLLDGVLVVAVLGGVAVVPGAGVLVVAARVGVVVLVHLVAVGDAPPVRVLEPPLLQGVLVDLAEVVGAGPGLLLGGLLGAKVVVALLPVVVEPLVVEAALVLVVVELLLAPHVLVALHGVALAVDPVELGLVEAPVGGVQRGGGGGVLEVVADGLRGPLGGGVVPLEALLPAVPEALPLVGPPSLLGLVSLDGVLEPLVS